MVLISHFPVIFVFELDNLDSPNTFPIYPMLPMICLVGYREIQDIGSQNHFTYALQQTEYHHEKAQGYLSALKNRRLTTLSKSSVLNYFY